MSAPTTPAKIFAHNVVHLRAEPDRQAERVSQGLMGQSAQVLERRDCWSYVETDDAYRGWCEDYWLADPPHGPLTPVVAVFAEMRAAPRRDAPLIVRLPILAAVQADPPETADGDWIAAALADGTTGWLPVAAFSHPSEKAFGPGTAVAWGQQFLGTPYLWGGSSSFGLDCSGFVQLCYRLAGIVLRRDADIQRTDPRFVPVAPPDLAPGDLVFFGSPERITHVGMHLDAGTYIHASSRLGGVVITRWDDNGYSPRFVDGRRLDPARAAEPVTRP